MSTRSGGPSSSARPSARTSIRVLRIPCSIRNERTASARDNERRRAELRVSTVPPAYAFNCRRPSLFIIVTARDPNLRSASGVSRVLAPRKSMRRICPPSGGNGTRAARRPGAPYDWAVPPPATTWVVPRRSGRVPAQPWRAALSESAAAPQQPAIVEPPISGVTWIRARPAATRPLWPERTPPLWERAEAPSVRAWTQELPLEPVAGQRVALPSEGARRASVRRLAVPLEVGVRRRDAARSEVMLPVWKSPPPRNRESAVARLPSPALPA